MGQHRHGGKTQLDSTGLDWERERELEGIPRFDQRRMKMEGSIGTVINSILRRRLKM